MMAYASAKLIVSRRTYCPRPAVARSGTRPTDQPLRCLRRRRQRSTRCTRRRRTALAHTARTQPRSRPPRSGTIRAGRRRPGGQSMCMRFGSTQSVPCHLLMSRRLEKRSPSIKFLDRDDEGPWWQIAIALSYTLVECLDGCIDEDCLHVGFQVTSALAVVSSFCSHPDTPVQDDADSTSPTRFALGPGRRYVIDVWEPSESTLAMKILRKRWGSAR